jgi:hypothetical protein
MNTEPHGSSPTSCAGSLSECSHNQQPAEYRCGDCGGLIIPSLDVNVWFHLDDGSPQCRNRRDAARRKPGHFCCLECGEPPNEPHRKSCKDSSGLAGGKMALQEQGTPIQVEVTCCQEHADEARATEIRKAMVATGQPLADLAEEIRTCRWCRKALYQMEEGGSFYASEPEPGTASGVCMEAPADGTYPEHVPGPFWDTEALTREFEVIGFASPFVVVRRKSDGVKGSLEFTHRPRVYFNWTEAT